MTADEAADAAAPELTGFLHASMPFTASLGAEALSAGPDEVRTRVAWDASRCTAGGVLHGGLLMALADATAAWCAFLHVPEGGSTTTVESKTNFLRPVRAGSPGVHKVGTPGQRCPPRFFAMTDAASSSPGVDEPGR